jgi:hypothetical protein
MRKEPQQKTLRRKEKPIDLIPRFDVIVVDEVQKIRTDEAGKAMAGTDGSDPMRYLALREFPACRQAGRQAGV